MITYILEILDLISLENMPYLNWVMFALELLYLGIRLALLIFPAESKVGKFLRKIFVGYRALRTKINELEAQNKIKDDIINGTKPTDTTTDADTDAEPTATSTIDARTSSKRSSSEPTATTGDADRTKADFVDQLKRRRGRRQ